MAGKWNVVKWALTPMGVKTGKETVRAAFRSKETAIMYREELQAKDRDHKYEVEPHQPRT